MRISQSKCRVLTSRQSPQRVYVLALDEKATNDRVRLTAESPCLEGHLP